MATIQEAIRRLRYVFTSEGADKVAGDLNKVGHAQAAVTARSTQTERAALSLDRQFGNLERRMVAGVRAQQDYEKVQRQVNAAVQQNPALQERANVVLAAARQRYTEATQAVEQHDGAFGRLANTMTRRLIYAALISQVKEAARAIIGLNAELAKTGDVATRIGSSGGNFQGLTGAAGFKGIGAGSFADDMLKFSQHVDEARSGLGSLGTLLRANRLTVTDTSDAFFKVSDLVRNATSEAQKFSILQQAGLPASREFVRFMEQGADVIRKQGTEVSKLTDQQLRDAQILEDRWNTLWTNFTRRGKAAVLEVNDPNNWKISIEPGSFADKLFRALSGNSEPTLRITVGPSSGYRVPAADQALRDIPAPAGSAGTTIDPAKQRELLQLEQQRIGVLGNIASIEEALRSKQIDINLARMAGVKISKEEEAVLLSKARIEAESQRLQFQLLFERQQLGRDSIEQRVASDLRSAGIDAGSAIGQLMADQIRLNEQLRIGKDLAGDFASGFIRDLRQGTSAIDALTNALNRMADKLLQMANDKMIAGLMSGVTSMFGPPVGGPNVGGPNAEGVLIYGPGMHSGGIVGSDATFMRATHPAYFDNAPRFHGGGMVGSDEVPIIAQRGEGVFTAEQMRAMGGMGAPSITVNLIENPARAGEVDQSSDDHGGITIDVMVDRITARNTMTPGSETDRAHQMRGRLIQR